MYNNLKKLAKAAPDPIRFPPPTDEMARLAQSLIDIYRGVAGVGTTSGVFKNILPIVRQSGRYGALFGGPLGALLAPGHRLEGFGRGTVRGAGAGVGARTGTYLSGLLGHLLKAHPKTRFLGQPVGTALGGIGGAVVGDTGANSLLNTFMGKPTWERK